MTDPHRYPLDQLAKQLHIPLGRTGGHQPGDPPDGLALLAEHLNISHRWAQHLHHHGLTDQTADRLAITAGYHPATIWPDWWDHADDTDDNYYSDDPPIETLTPHPARAS